MTTRELRQMLFNVSDQEMTVRDLRNLLFTVSEQGEELTQDKELIPCKLYQLTTFWTSLRTLISEF